MYFTKGMRREMKRLGNTAEFQGSLNQMLYKLGLVSEALEGMFDTAREERQLAMRCE
jgi:hypothetical protein